MQSTITNHERTSCIVSFKPGGPLLSYTKTLYIIYLYHIIVVNHIGSVYEANKVNDTYPSKCKAHYSRESIENDAIGYIDTSIVTLYVIRMIAMIIASSNLQGATFP